MTRVKRDPSLRTVLPSHTLKEERSAKTQVRKEPQFRLGFLLHDVSRLRRTVVDKALKPLDLTRSQWWVLANLSRYPGEGITQTELANQLDVGKVALGDMIDRIEANGYIRRTPDPVDRRAKRIAVTPAGIALLDAIRDYAAEINREMMKGVSPEEIAATENILHRMKLRLLELDNQVKQDGGIGDAFPAPPRLKRATGPRQTASPHPAPARNKPSSGRR